MKFKIIPLFLLSTLTVFSQTKKGDIFLQATLQATGSFYQSYYINNNTFSAPVLKLAAGIFISNHNAVGLQILGSNINDRQNSKNGYQTGVGAIHLYMYPFGDKWGFSWYNEGTFSKGRMVYKVTADNPNASNKTIALNSSPGLYCLLFNRVAIHASFNLLNINYNKIYTDKENTKFETAHAFEDFTMTGLLPGSLSLSEVQIRLAYFIRKK